MKIYKFLAVGFGLLLLYIVYLANSGSTAFVFRMIHHIPFGDKIGHLGLMGILSFLTNLALSGRTIAFGGWRVWLGVIIVMSIVLIEEISQIWIPSRTFSFGDLFFDAIGIVTGAWLAVYFMRYAK